MRIPHTLLFLILVCLSSPAFSQSDFLAAPSRNSFYVEGFGNALIYSVNFDRILVVKEKSALTGRIGVSYAPPPNKGPGVVLEMNYLRGSGNHHFELGAGCSYYYLFSKDELIDPNITLFFLTARIGYRYQKKEGGFLFRVGLIPIFAVNVDQDITDFEKNFIPYGGISFGYTLKSKNKE